MLGDANNVASFFPGILGTGGFNGAEVDVFTEGEAEEDTGVNSEAGEGGEGNILDGIVPQVIEEEASAKEGKEPELGRGTGAIHNAVSSVLDKLNAQFSGVLLVAEGFTSPSGNGKSTHEVKGSTTNFNLLTVGEELNGAATKAHIVFKGVDKLLGRDMG